ncbi:MAG: protein MIGRI [Vogesella sp.]|uniref:protein MIGRI n=1 Tax=Vogesella sp. TaxID=1904252 RepID=UPI00391D4D2D
MIGRLLRLALLCLILVMVVRWLFNRQQRATLQDFFHTLAISLVISSVLFFVLYMAGVHL